MEDTAGCLALSLAYTQFSYTVHNYLPMATTARSSLGPPTSDSPADIFTGSLMEVILPSRLPSH